MENNKKIPNKKIRTIILGLILLIYLSTTIYVAITKENNRLSGHDIKDIYLEKYKDTDYDYNNYEYDDEYEETKKDKELNVNSEIVQKLYSYIKDFTYIKELNGSFDVSKLTEKDKMRLVISALNNTEETTQITTEILEKEIYDNNIQYVAETPNIKYDRYIVMYMYRELFDTTIGFDTAVSMYDGENIIYKYNETVSGYIKYIKPNTTEATIQKKAKLTKVVEKNKILELHVENGTIKEIYKFEETYSYEDDYKEYKFIGRTTNQEKNSL